MSAERQSGGDNDVPIFGSWRNIYTAVVLVNLAAIAFCAFFSRFGF